MPAAKKAPAKKAVANGASNAAQIEAYLAAVPQPARDALVALRQAIRAAAPDADEVISYKIPTFKHHGFLVGYAAAKQHCAFYVMSPGPIEAHQEELSGYDTAPTAIRFKPEKPLPAALVKKIVKARMAENASRKK